MVPITGLATDLPRPLDPDRIGATLESGDPVGLTFENRDDGLAILFMQARFLRYEPQDQRMTLEVLDFWRLFGDRVRHPALREALPPNAYYKVPFERAISVRRARVFAVERPALENLADSAEQAARQALKLGWDARLGEVAPDPVSDRYREVERQLSRIGMDFRAAMLRYYYTRLWILQRWSETEHSGPRVPSRQFHAALRRATSDEVFQRFRTAMTRYGHLERVQRTLSRFHAEKYWGAKFDANGEYRYVIEHDDPDRSVSLSAPEYEALKMIRHACYRAPYNYVHNNSVNDPAMQRHVRAATRRCLEFITENGLYLPAGISLDKAVERRVEALTGGVSIRLEVVDPEE